MSCLFVSRRAALRRRRGAELVASLPPHVGPVRWLVVTVALWMVGASAPSSGAGMTNAVLYRATSASRQFTAFAPNSLLASVTCVFAERVKHEWLAQLDLADNWRDPIVIAVRERDPASPAQPALSVDAFQNEIHLKYQITCVLPPPLDEGSLTVALVGALCEEFSNRDQRTSRTTAYERAMIPPWLAWGLAASIRDRDASFLGVLRHSVEAGRPATATELLARTPAPTDPAEQELFRADAWVLTKGLLSLPSGAQKMQRFLVALGETKSASNAFTASFGADFPGPVAMEKWWSLQQAVCSAATAPGNLSVEETARRLDELLPTALVENEETKNAEVRTQLPFDQLWRYYDKPWMPEVLRAKVNSLEMLRSQTHPLYRSVIDGYIRASILLMEEKLGQHRRAVAAADRARAAVERKGRQITAYLDREERIHSPDDFHDWLAGYFQTLNQIEALDENRHNPISDYLDQFDR